MQKIVVGIIAVFFVQVGFQIYLAVDRTNSEFASLAVAPGPRVPSNNSAAVPTLDDLYRTSIRDGETASPRERVVASTQDRPRAQFQAVKAILPIPHAPAEYRSAAIGPDIVITIPPPIRPAYSSTTSVASASVGRERKRSFLSKSVHVLKKPYDWLKTVAMKLD